jgi:hypothetical protein
MKRPSAIVLFAFALSLMLELNPVLLASATSPIGVHVGDKFTYSWISTSPTRYSSIWVVTVTEIDPANSYIYCSVTERFLSGPNAGTTIHWPPPVPGVPWSGYEDISKMWNTGLDGFFIFPANLKAGRFDTGSMDLGTIDIHTENFPPIVDYSYITKGTWRIYLKWLQKTGVIIYANYQMPGMGSGTLTLLGPTLLLV